MTATVLLLTALAATASPDGQDRAEGGFTMQDSPPPRIIAVPSSPPSPPFRVIPPPPPGPPPPLPVIVDPPRAKAPLQALISELDYPASALANREAGREATA